MCCGTGLAVALMTVPAAAQEKPKLKVVATISILGDLVKNVGGDRVDVTTLVGPNGDAHVYEPTPGDAKKLADADIVFVNGLGLEGWMTRLVEASGTKASVVVVSKGVTPLKTPDGGEAPVRSIRTLGNRSPTPRSMSPTSATVWIRSILSGKPTYDAATKTYLAKLDDLEKEVGAAIVKHPRRPPQDHHHP